MDVLGANGHISETMVVKHHFYCVLGSIQVF